MLPTAVIHRDDEFARHSFSGIYGLTAQAPSSDSAAGVSAVLLDPIAEKNETCAVVFDRQCALRRMGNSEELLLDVMRLIQVESPLVHENMHSTFEKRAATELQRAAHTLKGSVSLVGANDLCARLKLVEEFASRKKFDEVANELPEIDRQFNELQRQLAMALKAY